MGWASAARLALCLCLVTDATAAAKMDPGTAVLRDHYETSVEAGSTAVARAADVLARAGNELDGRLLRNVVENAEERTVREQARRTAMVLAGIYGLLCVLAAVALLCASPAWANEDARSNLFFAAMASCVILTSLLAIATGFVIILGSGMGGFVTAMTGTFYLVPFHLACTFVLVTLVSSLSGVRTPFNIFACGIGIAAPLLFGSIFPLRDVAWRIAAAL
jgi:uncharacterized membrane protein YozB (DUF420 family)